MTEVSWVAIISVAVTLLTNLVGHWVSSRKIRPEIRGMDAKTESEIVAAANAIASGSTVPIENLLRSVEYHKQEITELRAENTKLETDVVAIKEARKACDLEIDAIKEARRKRDLEVQVERDALEARIKAELIDSRNIRIENTEMTKRINKLEDMVVKQFDYIDVMKTSMQKASILVPLNGELLETARRLKLSIEERERIKATQ